MCGIFGMYLNRPLNDKDINIGQKGLALLKHRGPDASNVFINKHDGILLGHNRLSIIDVTEKSNQPMQFGKFVIVYNGELYNYLEIAKKLIQNNVSLKTNGDTEVLFKAWIHWGKKALDYFDGMYAFAIYNTESVHIVTDGFGEKPMYWYESTDGVYFSSEPGPLINVLGISPDFKEEDIVSFLSLGFIPGKRTGFSKLYKVEPGSIIKFEKNGKIYQEKYWQPLNPVENKGQLRPLANNDIEDIINILIESLSFRLRADVPLSLFLSSGIDSTLVAALATKELKKNINAFTVSFSNSNNNESENAKRIANYLKLDHEIVECDDTTSPEDKNLFFKIYGEPNDNLTALAAYKMSVLASNKYKVALTGIGADEIFYGYGKYHYLYKYERLKYFIQIAFKFLPFLRNKYSKISELDSINNKYKFLYIKNSSTFSWLSEFPYFENFIESYFSSNKAVSSYSRYFDLTQTMPFNFIPALERASMKASLEIRTPFLNRKLFDLVENLDIRMLLGSGQKALLKNILLRYLPKKYFEYPKIGFIYPAQNYIGYFDKNELRNIKIGNHNTGIIWDNIDDEHWQRIAIRAITLNHFLN
jgi:asparagine synthase (glutamine-hydrolysing)